jgi:hypothetical protein
MTMRRLFYSLLLACTACSVVEQPSGLIPRWTTAYRQIIHEDDRVRLRDWRTSFTEALASARATGHASEIDREAALLNPDAALTQPGLPNGMYRCRVMKLGAKQPENLTFVSYPSFTCRVLAERELQRLTKLTGSQRYVGLIFPSDALRNVFLGTLVLGDETRAMQYGQDEQRDVAAYVERIGPQRWRLIMPEPRFESRIDVMELVPAGATP